MREKLRAGDRAHFMATPRTDTQTRLGEVLRRVASHRAERVYDLADAVKRGREIDRLSFLRQDVAGARSHLLRALALVRWVRSNPPLDRLSAATSEATEDRLHGESIRETARHELVFSAAAKSAPPFDVRNVNGLLSVGYLPTVPRCIVPRGASFTAHPTDVLRLLSSLVRQRMADAGSPMNAPYTVNDGVVELSSPHGWTLCATLASASPDAPWHVLRAGSRIASCPSLPSSCRTLPMLGPQAEEALVARAQQLVDAADTHFDALRAAASVAAAVHAGLHLHAIALQMRAWQRATGLTHVRSWVSYGRAGEADRVEVHFWGATSRPTADAGAALSSATAPGACSMVVQVGQSGETTARLTPHVGSLPLSTHVTPHLRSTCLDVGSAVEAARAFVTHRALVALAACLSRTATGPSVSIHRRRLHASRVGPRATDSAAAPPGDGDGALVAHRLRIRLVHGLALTVTVCPETGALQLDVTAWGAAPDADPVSSEPAAAAAPSRKRPRPAAAQRSAPVPGAAALDGTCWLKPSMAAAARAVRQLTVHATAGEGGAASTASSQAQSGLRTPRTARLHGAASAAVLEHAASESARVVLAAVHEAATAALATVVRRAAVLCGAGTPLRSTPQASHSATDALPQAQKDLLRVHGGPHLLRPLSFRAQSGAERGTEAEGMLREQVPGAGKANVWIRAATPVQGDAEVCLLVSLTGTARPPHFLLVLTAPTSEAKVSPRFVADLGTEGLRDATSPQLLGWAVARALRRAAERASVAILTAMGSPTGDSGDVPGGDGSTAGPGAGGASLGPLVHSMGTALAPPGTGSSGGAAAVGRDDVCCVLPLRSDLAAMLRLRGPAVVTVRAAVTGTHARIRLDLPLAEDVTRPRPPRALHRIARAAFHPPPDSMASYTPGRPRFEGTSAIVVDHAVNRLAPADDAPRRGQSMSRAARTSSVSQSAVTPGMRVPLLATRLRELGEVACSLLLLAPRAGGQGGSEGSALEEVASARAPWSGARPTDKEYAAKQMALVRLALAGSCQLVDALFTLVALEPDWLELRVRNTSVHCAVYLHFEGDVSLGGYSSTSATGTHSIGTLRLACSKKELRSIALEYSVLLASAALSGNGRSPRGREEKAEGQRRGRSGGIGIVSATPADEGVLAHHSALRVAVAALSIMALATHFLEARSRLGQPKRSELEPVSHSVNALEFWSHQKKEVTARLRRSDEEQIESHVVFEFSASAQSLTDKAMSVCKRAQSSTTSHGEVLLRTSAEDAVAVARSLASM